MGIVRLGLLILISFVAEASTEAATTAPAVIEGTQAWDITGEPYTIAGDVTIREGARLTIAPGVTVAFAGPYTLRVDGELVARGTQGEPIVFTGPAGDSAPRWKSILFTSSSVGAEYEDLDDYSGGSILEWCVFERGTNAVRLDGASPCIRNCTFRDNQTEGGIDVVGGAAILIENGAAPRIRGCTFDGNAARPFNFGGAIYAVGSAPIIQDCVFTNNTSSYGGAISTDSIMSPIVGNRFEGNDTLSEGGAVSLLSTSSAFLNNTVTGNHADTDGGGVHICVDCFPHANPFVMDNTITGNTSDNTDPAKGAAGFGAAYLRMFRDNNLHGNLRAGVASDFGWFQRLSEGYGPEIADPDIASNWWGTTEVTLIGQTVFDGYDDAEYGTATFAPPLAGPVEQPTPRIAVTTRKIRYRDEGDPMSTFLTIYNPGPRREMEVILMLGYDTGPPLPYHGTLPGMESRQRNGVYLLAMPENSVYFATLTEPPYREGHGRTSGAWHAILIDATTGERIGEVCSSLFLLGEGGGA